MKKSSENKKTTLMKRLIILIVASSFVHSLLFYSILSFSGAISRLDRSSEKLFKESNSKRAVLIENEMLSKWNDLTNITAAAETACGQITAEKGVTAKELLESKELRTKLLEEISDEMLNTLRINSVNGVFVVLANNGDVPDRSEYGLYDGVYFNDSDTRSNPADYADIILARGPGSIAERYSLMLDIMWKENFENIENGTDMDFFFDPVEAAYSCPGFSAKDLGVWKSVFYRYPNMEYGQKNILTYSEPIIFDGAVLGSAGISLSMEHIAGIISPGRSMGVSGGFYFFAEEKDGGKSLKISCASGADDGISSYGENTFYIDKTGSNDVYLIRDEKINGSQALCTFERLDLYGEAVPYDKGSFVVGAAVGENDLYNHSSEIRKNLLTAFVLSVIICSGATYFTARFIVRPIKKLSENIEKASGGSAIEIVDTDVTEIHDLSVTLNDLSSRISEYNSELVAERERYIIALSSANDRIVEYDCVKDIFSIHYFIRTKDGGTVDMRQFENFRRLIDEGRVCPEDGVTAMLDFISTDAADNGMYIKVFANDEQGKCLWFYSKGKAIYDGGRLVRVIASAKNVTNEKEREQQSLEKKRRNSVTGFYNYEYGNVLISRFMAEMRGKTSVSATIAIVQFREFLNKYGTAFFDAILEEAAAVIKKHIPEDYIIFHGQKTGLVLLTPLESREEARELFRKIIDGIENIYSGGVGDEVGIHLNCVIGACFCEDGNGISILRRRLMIASAASFKFREEFNGIVFEDEIPNREDFIREFDSTGHENYINMQSESEFDNSNIVSFAFNIFEKTGNFNAALYAFMSRAGRELDLERILIFETNLAQCSIKLIHQWNASGMAPIEPRVNKIEKEEFDRYTEKFRSGSCVPADKAMLDKDARRGRGRMTGNGAAIAAPMFDNDSIIGFMAYELSAETASESFIGCLKELTTIVSAYFSKSGAVRESRAKSEFLSKMSHEIRTPMNAIIGMTDIALSTEEGTPAINNYLKKIDSSSHYLLSLINDILDMSKIENGKMTTEETYINLEKTITQIYDMMRIQTDIKGIWLRLEKDIKHPHLLSDPLKLNQILVNILGNAVKFTARGGITLSVMETSCADGTANISFSVRDTGIGISEENLDRIFNSFEQADEKTMRKYGGTGLGLAISSNLVRLLGGQLEVNSVPDKGSEFYFTLAMKITEPAEEDYSSIEIETDLSERTILVVDDDDLNREIACTFLEDRGVKTETAVNGQVAAEMFASSETGYYDAILMDIRMPVMDGIEATKMIRGMNRADAETIPIVAMSANAFDEDMQRSMESGMNCHLTKPMDIKKVMETLGRLWNRH